MAYEVLIQTEGKVYSPAVLEDVKWSTDFEGVPGKLDLTVLNDSTLKVSMGSPIRLKQDDKVIFFGYVFDVKEDKSGELDLLCYDQLRFLTNRDVYIYEHLRADQFVRMVAKDYLLDVGTLDNTGYTIPSRVEDNQSVFNMILTALDLTREHTGRRYCLFDSAGKLSLRDTNQLRVPYVITVTMAEDFRHQLSIDSESYNQVKLIREIKADNDTTHREIYVEKDINNINKWGVLQYFGKLEEDENGQAKAKSLLRQYNRPGRTLAFQGVFGDNRVRAGSQVFVSLQLMDTKVEGYMVVEKAVHHFGKDVHTMDLTVSGRGFNA